MDIAVLLDNFRYVYFAFGILFIAAGIVMLFLRRKKPMLKNKKYSIIFSIILLFIGTVNLISGFFLINFILSML